MNSNNNHSILNLPLKGANGNALPLPSTVTASTDCALMMVNTTLRGALRMKRQGNDHKRSRDETAQKRRRKTSTTPSRSSDHDLRTKSSHAPPSTPPSSSSSEAETRDRSRSSHRRARKRHDKEERRKRDCAQRLDRIIREVQAARSFSKATDERLSRTIKQAEEIEATLREIAESVGVLDKSVTRLENAVRGL